MDLSLYLCRLFGLYLFFVTLLYFLRKDYLEEAVDDYFASPGLSLITGVFTLLLGLFLTLAHNVWELNYRGVVTLLCYLTLLKAITVLFLPNAIKLWKENLFKTPFFYVHLALWFAVGIYLLYEGFLVAQL